MDFPGICLWFREELTHTWQCFGLDVLRPGKLGVIMGTSFVQIFVFQKETGNDWNLGTIPARNNGWNLAFGGRTDICIRSGKLVSAKTSTSRKKMEIPMGSFWTFPKESYSAQYGVTGTRLFQGNRMPIKDALAKRRDLRIKYQAYLGAYIQSGFESVSYGTYNIIKNFEDYGI